jgi:hypothetical protein
MFKKYFRMNYEQKQSLKIDDIFIAEDIFGNPSKYLVTGFTKRINKGYQYKKIISLTDEKYKYKDIPKTQDINYTRYLSNTAGSGKTTLMQRQFDYPNIEKDFNIEYLKHNIKQRSTEMMHSIFDQQLLANSVRNPSNFMHISAT